MDPLVSDNVLVSELCHDVILLVGTIMAFVSHLFFETRAI